MLRLMSASPGFAVRWAVRRAGHALIAAARGRGRARVRLGGFAIEVPRGVSHPGLDPAAGFFLRTVGPMVAPGQRVLVLDAGVGLLALAAASRGAAVVAREADLRAREAAAANATTAGVPVVDGTPAPGEVTFEVELGSGWDLVLWNPSQRSPRERRRVCGMVEDLPRLVGESGRLLIAVEQGSGLEDDVRAALPDLYRVVVLARDLGLRSVFRVLCLGYDQEEARARRHAERARTRAEKAAVSRRRWEREPDEARAAPETTSAEPGSDETLGGETMPAKTIPQEIK